MASDAGVSRLHARPWHGTSLSVAPGRTELRVSGGREVLLEVPPGIGDASPAGLCVLLHGAGSTPRAALTLLEGVAAAERLVLLAPKSLGATWDVIRGGFGPDVALIDEALAAVFAACPVDPERVVLGGFSDGASYAVSLGMGNGDLFTHLLAFSPGFAAPAEQIGTPRVFISHGVDDRVLPVDRCSRRLVALLRAGEYDVTYEEFDGGHEVPAWVARRALGWIAGRPAGPGA